MKKYTFYLKTILLLLGIQSLTFASSNIETAQVEEICDNRIDDDGDGLVDCLDPDCSGTETCWECLTEFYQVHSNQYLVKLDPYTGAYETLGNISGATSVNGAQFNHIDGHVYAPIIVDGVHKLGMIQSNGLIIPLELDLSTVSSSIFYVGAIDAQGVMYVANSAGIFSIDLTAETLTVVDTGLNNPGVADFALDLTNGLFYGVNSSGKLVVFDPINVNTTNYNLAGPINNESGGFGACWSSNDGSFFAYNNSSGKIYSVNPDDLTATLVLNGTGNLSINDGFNCVTANPPFETNCNNMIDDDGDGLIDCDDPDCYNSNVCTMEICNNGIDDDNDGWIDCSDSECFDLEICLEICDNNIDDNNNGLIDAEDPQCNTPSGVTGGLESNRRLSGLIAQRNFKTKVLDSKEYDQKLEGLLPFKNEPNRNAINIADFIPTEFEGTFVSESSPIDLIEITNAVDVSGADYYLQDRRIATVLGIYSENGVYEHSKYICDRLDGSRLIDISYLFAYGGNFISYELINKEGQKEYAVSFAARIKEDGFYIENHWNLHKYDKDSHYYNFQIWGQSYPEIIALLTDVLHRMNNEEEIQSIEHSEIPMVFITQGEYQNGKLNLSIKNKNLTKDIQFKSSMRRTETAEIEEFNIDLTLSGAYEEQISITTGPMYDLGASLNFPNSPSDEIFLADGSWGVDDSSLENSIIKFSIKKDNRENNEDEYHVERSVILEANVPEYLNLYRSLDAKLNPQDLSDYNTFAFTASGTCIVQITLVKETITNWEDQARTEIKLSETPQDYNISFEDFVSTSDDSFLSNDVTMIVFSLLNTSDYSTFHSLELSNLRFTNFTATSENSINYEITNDLFPNPVIDQAILKTNLGGKNVEFQVYNALGREVYHKDLESTIGENIYDLDFSNIPIGHYYYTIKEKNQKIKFGKFARIKS